MRPAMMSVASMPPAARPVTVPLAVAAPYTTGVTSSSPAGAIPLLVILTACCSGVPTRTFGNSIVPAEFSVISAEPITGAAGSTVPSTVIVCAVSTWVPALLRSIGVSTIVSLTVPDCVVSSSTVPATCGLPAARSVMSAKPLLMNAPPFATAKESSRLSAGATPMFSAVSITDALAVPATTVPRSSTKLLALPPAVSGGPELSIADVPRFSTGAILPAATTVATTSISCAACVWL